MARESFAFMVELANRALENTVPLLKFKGFYASVTCRFVAGGTKSGT